MRRFTLLLSFLLSAGSVFPQESRFSLGRSRTVSGHESFCVSNNVTGTVSWYFLGDSVSSWQLESWDQNSGILTLRNGNDLIFLSKVPPGVDTSPQQDVAAIQSEDVLRMELKAALETLESNGWYRIRPGDTLPLLAQEWGVTISQILGANPGLEHYRSTLRILWIRKPKAAEPGATDNPVNAQ